MTGASAGDRAPSPSVRGLFRVGLPDGSVRLAVGDTRSGPADLLAPDATIAGILRAGRNGLHDAVAGPTTGPVPAGVRVLAPLDVQEVWAAGRHLPAVARSPRRGGVGAVRLRQGLRGRPAGALLQVDRRARPGDRRADRHPVGFELGRPRAGAGPRRQLEPRDRGLHARRRRVEPVDRGRQPALPAAGQVLSLVVRDRAGSRAR